MFDDLQRDRRQVEQLPCLDPDHRRAGQVRPTATTRLRDVDHDLVRNLPRQQAESLPAGLLTGLASRRPAQRARRRDLLHARPGLRVTSCFNAQFSDWLNIANARMVRTIKARPVDLLDADRAAMLPLPPVAPAVGCVNRVRLGRDYYVRIDSSDYSVDPAVIGKFVDVTADLANVEVRHGGRLVAAHQRVWARGQTVTDPAHVTAAKVLREQFQLPRPAADPDVGLVRDLADYDRAFGLIDGGLTDAPAGEEVA